MKIKEYFRPQSIEEAFKIAEEKNAVVIGGGAFLHLQKREVEAAVDISALGLDYIEEKEGQIEIGAMTPLRKIEMSELLKGSFDGVVSKTAAAIMGVQVRNMATIGGAVYGRYGFSDLLTSLLSLDTHVELVENGAMALEDFIESGIKGDILTKIVIKKEDRKALYSNVRNTSTDFSILNTAVSRTGDEFRISVGARPLGAKLAVEAMDFLKGVEIDEESAERAGKIAAENLSFGSDLRGSAEYRKELCSVLIKRGIMGVV